MKGWYTGGFTAAAPFPLLIYKDRGGTSVVSKPLEGVSTPKECAIPSGARSVRAASRVLSHPSADSTWSSLGVPAVCVFIVGGRNRGMWRAGEGVEKGERGAEREDELDEPLRASIVKNDGPGRHGRRGRWGPRLGRERRPLHAPALRTSTLTSAVYPHPHRTRRRLGSQLLQVVAQAGSGDERKRRR
ncbi:hypothetical protein B0H17DRAFT_1134891 [Mycena rosella]|uniref:Uncharacterized protein n=1 Tax=Mycena rosella TaxID=1033263 RepID=A0AAD7DEX7_MYCRO|nr:hypothetical protein B0H17DRAFT_1134891 [Mycena rosella]